MKKLTRNYDDDGIELLYLLNDVAHGEITPAGRDRLAKLRKWRGEVDAENNRLVAADARENYHWRLTRFTDGTGIQTDEIGSLFDDVHAAGLSLEQLIADLSKIYRARAARVRRSTTRPKKQRS